MFFSNISGIYLPSTSTSPSVYVLFHQITAWAGCKGHPNTQLGPKLTSAFFPFKLNQISTLMPHKTYTGNGQTMGTRQLRLKDIMSDCTMPFNRKSAISNTAPRVGDHGYRCYPRLAIPLTIRDFANPWWHGCNIFSRKDGMIDPPYALTPGVGLATLAPVIPVPDSPDEMVYPGDDQVVTLENPTTEAGFEEPTPAPVQNPAPAQVPDAELPAITAPPNQPSIDPSEAPQMQQPDLESGGSLTPDDQKAPGSNNNATPPSDAASENDQPANNEPANNSPPQGQHDSGNGPVGAVSVSVIATNVIAAPPTESGGKSPNDAEQKPDRPSDGAPTNPEPNTSHTVSMTVEPLPLAAAGSEPKATPAEEPDRVIYMGHTLEIGGPLATVTNVNAVLSYGPKGVIVQYPHGVESTIPVAERPSIPSVLTNGSPNPTHAVDALGVSVTATGASTSTSASKFDEAADIASFINFVVNGNPSPGVSTTTVPGVSSNPVPGSIPNSGSNGAAANGTSSDGGNSTSNDSTEGVVLFTGNSIRGRAMMWWVLGAVGFGTVVVVL